MDWLFDSTGFVPRAHCGAGWTRELIAWDVCGQVATFAAYVVIGVLLVLASRWIRNLAAEDRPPSKLLPSFAAFIVSCGLGHLLGSLVFFWPAYRLFILWDFITAVVSIRAVAATIEGLYWLKRTYIRIVAERDQGTRKFLDLVAHLDKSAKRVHTRMEDLHHKLIAFAASATTERQLAEVKELRSLWHKMKNDFTL